MRKKGVAFEEVYDLFAIRIIINSQPEKEKADCWKIYSMITDEYSPSPERLRDWLSNPKSNGYEALHTTVMGPQGKWVEVQIRSKRMNEIAEKGLAAHWKYKEGASDESRFDKWFQQIREMLNMEDNDSINFLHDFKTSFLAEDIICVYAQGRCKNAAHGFFRPRLCLFNPQRHRRTVYRRKGQPQTGADQSTNCAAATRWRLSPPTNKDLLKTGLPM